MTPEAALDPGEFYETPNGNIYLKISQDHCVYICNRDMTRVPWQTAIRGNTSTPCAELKWKEVRHILSEQ